LDVAGLRGGHLLRINRASGIRLVNGKAPSDATGREDRKVWGEAGMKPPPILA